MNSDRSRLFTKLLILAVLGTALVLLVQKGKLTGTAFARNELPTMIDETKAFELTDVTIHSDGADVYLRNVTDKVITAYDLTADEYDDINGTGLSFDSVCALIPEAEGKIKPGQIARVMMGAGPSGIHLITIKAVIFEDKSVAGIAGNIRILTDARSIRKQRLEKILASIDAFLNSSDVETTGALDKLANDMDLDKASDLAPLLKRKSLATEDDMLGQVREIKERKRSDKSVSQRHEIISLKQDLERLISRF